MVFEWKDGECMGRMYEESHQNIMNLPLKYNVLVKAINAERNKRYTSIIEFADKWNEEVK